MKRYYILLTGFFVLLCGLVWAQPTVPPNPATCNQNNCTTNGSIDVCPANGNNIISSFLHQKLHTNAGNNGKAVGSVWWYRNIATITGQTVNCAITIDAIFNAVLDNVDDSTAVDQSNNSIADFFAPRIGPDQNLNSTSRRGYVQFTATFFKNSTGTNNGTDADFATSVSLTSLNYVHYDIDGSAENSGNPSAAWFRETGVAKRVSAGNPNVVANSPTELVSYTYTDVDNWAGFAGSVCERDGVSKCAQVAASYSYNGAQPSITFRMGYDFKADANGYNFGNTIRQYGSRFGCFNFPQQGSLPITLLSFNAILKNQSTVLNWTAENAYNFDRFEVERSSNGYSFSSIGTRPGVGTTSKTDYSYNDDLSMVSDNYLYYRLKMIDLDGSVKYSNVIMVRKDQKGIVGISVVPNPVTNGMATIKLNSTDDGVIELRVIDLTGKVVIHQQNKIFKGINSISVNDLSRLQPGVYSLQVVNSDIIMSSKFSVVK